MEILFSKTGSSGNASIISDGETLIQVDAGIPLKKVNEAIDYKINDVQAVFISHGHADHISNISDYLKYGIPCYVLPETATQAKTTGSKRNLKEFSFGEQIEVGTFIVKPFLVEHINKDGSDCPNAGFLIYSKITKEKMIWITDAACIESKFPAVEYICVECNYIDVDDYSKELEYVNAFVEKRRFKSHLSLSLCVDFLKKQDLSKIKQIRLLHLTSNQGKIKEDILETMHKEFPNIEFVV